MIKTSLEKLYNMEVHIKNKCMNVSRVDSLSLDKFYELAESLDNYATFWEIKMSRVSEGENGLTYPASKLVVDVLQWEEKGRQ